MLRNKICAFALCAGLALSLAGCMEQAASDVSDTASRVESGAGETVSRIESGLEEAGSRVGSAVESALDPDSSRREESKEESREEATPAPEPR